MHRKASIGSRQRCVLTVALAALAWKVGWNPSRIPKGFQALAEVFVGGMSKYFCSNRVTRMRNVGVDTAPLLLIRWRRSGGLT